MTAAAAKALAAQPILTALVACEACGEWTDRCVCPETATPAPGRDPQARIWGGDRGGRAERLDCPPARRAPGHPIDRNDKHPASPARRTQRAGGVPRESRSSHMTRPTLNVGIHVDAAHLDAADVTARTVNKQKAHVVAGIGNLDLYSGPDTSPEELADALERLADRIRVVDRKHKETGQTVVSAHQGADVEVLD